MRRITRTLAQLTLLSVMASTLTVVSAGTASAAESIPTLQYPAPFVPAYPPTHLVESSDGSVTVPCSMGTGLGESDLITYSDSGSVVRQPSRTTPIDGVPNCISSPVVDKNGDLYGIPGGVVSGNWVDGANLLAYDGSTLKWKYPARCGTSNTPLTVGADGNIYVLTRVSGDVRLLGLSPELEAGQTQPAVKVNIDVPNDCFVELLPYRGGIIIKPQSGSIQHYSYGGRLVSDRYITQWYNGVAGDDGVYFTPKTVGGSPTARNIVATHPAQGERWDVQVSTPGAGVQSIDLYPLANGGVAALIREQRMVQGVPAVPTEYIYTLAVLGANGQLLQREYMPNAAGTTNLGYPYVMPDSGGKMIVFRDITIPSGVSNPATMPGVAIGVYDPANDSWVQETMTGDNNAAGGPYGYRLETSHYRYPGTVTDDTVTFIGRCSGNCPSTGFRKLYALDISGVSTVYPKGAVLETAPRSGASYIALGDSFSSGEGVPPFETGTDIPGVNTCHRSTVAYPQLIAGSSPNIPSLGTDGFRACSGAVTTNVTDLAQWNESIQLDWWPDATTQVVTLTIGGNDIGFADFAKACVNTQSSCAINSAAYNTALGKINNELPAKLEATYKRILAYAPNAQIYVIGYPQVAPVKVSTDPLDPECIYLADGGTRWSEAQAVRDITTKLNAKVQTKVNDVRAMNVDYQRLHFVEVNGSGSPFSGHEVCGTSGTSFFLNVDQVVNNMAYVFHPNALGQEAYAELVEAAI
jgi:hypothetical protein